MKTLEVISWYGEICSYKITDCFSAGYYVWNIGRRNFPLDGYIPLGKMDTDGIHIKLDSLKALYVGNDISDYIINQAQFKPFGWDEFYELSKIVPELKKYIK